VKEREQDTRRQRIDPKLAASGWAIEAATKAAPADLSMPTALTEFPTHDGPADYALCANGRVIGVVEAKKLTIGPQGVLTQAECYSRGIQQQPATKASTACRPCTPPTAR
jgi:type I restriction enzyme R subunit